MNNTNNRPTTFVVVALGSMWAGPQLINKGETLEVDRPVRNEWIGSKLARDATDAEIETYRAEQGAVEDDSYLEDDRAALIAEIKALVDDRERLQEKKTELAGDLEALESDIADYEQRKVTIAAEVAELEAAKAAAAKATAAKK